MKKENIEKIKKKCQGANKGRSYSLFDRYEEKFGHCPMIPITMAYGIDNPDFKKMCKEAIERGTPLTDEDYERYFPTEKGVLY